MRYRDLFEAYGNSRRYRGKGFEDYHQPYIGSDYHKKDVENNEEGRIHKFIKRNEELRDNFISAMKDDNEAGHHELAALARKGARAHHRVVSKYKTVLKRMNHPKAHYADVVSAFGGTSVHAKQAKRIFNKYNKLKKAALKAAGGNQNYKYY